MSNKVSVEAVKVGILNISQTGSYPGGMDKLREDLFQLAESGEIEEISTLLENIGAADMGTPPMNIADYYKPGQELYELRWPIRNQLAIPFGELDRPTQFHVLFSEWSMRDLEAIQALNSGNTESALQIYVECLARAEQIDVAELIARSHEGLARVASKANKRQMEREHLLQAEYFRSRQ